jgi:aspartate/methionine/tyrosine aminotransferase
MLVLTQRTLTLVYLPLHLPLCDRWTQAGGLACLDPEGMSEINNLMDYYLDNAAILKKGIEACGFTAYGGEDAPYVFVDLGSGKSSWDMFSHIMENAQVCSVCTTALTTVFDNDFVAI